MLSRLRRHLSPSLVLSMIAVFFALGGGYAAAVSGSGVLKKGSLDSFTGETDLRTLPGFGTISVLCDTSFDEVDIRLDNTTASATIAYRTFTENQDLYNSGEVSPGSDDAIAEPGSTDTTQIHLFKTASGNKESVEATLSTRIAADVCTNATIVALDTIQ